MQMFIVTSFKIAPMERIQIAIKLSMYKRDSFPIVDYYFTIKKEQSTNACNNRDDSEVLH